MGPRSDVIVVFFSVVVLFFLLCVWFFFALFCWLFFGCFVDRWGNHSYTSSSRGLSRLEPQIKPILGPIFEFRSLRLLKLAAAIRLLPAALRAATSSLQGLLPAVLRVSADVIIDFIVLVM